jgi:DNA mismatch repair protein MutL
LEVDNAVSEPTETSFSLPQIARVRGFVSAPRDRRTSRDAQFLFVNGRFVRDRLIGRALSEGYRSILPHGVYPVALLFIDVPLEEVDVNVHPAKTEVRFRRAAAVADSVREAVRAALASAGFAPSAEVRDATVTRTDEIIIDQDQAEAASAQTVPTATSPAPPAATGFDLRTQPEQPRIGFAVPEAKPSPAVSDNLRAPIAGPAPAWSPAETINQSEEELRTAIEYPRPTSDAKVFPDLPPLDSAVKLVREVAVESVSSNIRPLGQLDESFIIATDDEGLLLIDQHVATSEFCLTSTAPWKRPAPESQHMLIPETFDLTPARQPRSITLPKNSKAMALN